MEFFGNTSTSTSSEGGNGHVSATIDNYIGHPTVFVYPSGSWLGSLNYCFFEEANLVGLASSLLTSKVLKCPVGEAPALGSGHRWLPEVG